MFSDFSAPPPAPDASLTHKTVTVALNATALYLLAYALVQTLFQVATLSTAARQGIRGVWELGRLQFLIADARWTRPAVLSVYGVGPVVCLGVLVVAFWLFWKWARQQRGLLKLFLFWVMMHACNLSWGALAADTLTQTGVWYVPSWLFLAGNAINVAVAVLAALVQMVLGYAAALVFLQSHDSITLMQYTNRRRLLLAAAVGPWLVGSALLLVLQWPTQSLTEQLRYAAMLLLLGPLCVASTNELFEGTIESPGRTRLATALLVLAALVLLAGRLVLAHGIHFG